MTEESYTESRGEEMDIVDRLIFLLFLLAGSTITGVGVWVYHSDYVQMPLIGGVVLWGVFIPCIAVTLFILVSICREVKRRLRG